MFFVCKLFVPVFRRSEMVMDLLLSMIAAFGQDNTGMEHIRLCVLFSMV